MFISLFEHSDRMLLLWHHKLHQVCRFLQLIKFLQVWLSNTDVIFQEFRHHCLCWSKNKSLSWIRFIRYLLLRRVTCRNFRMAYDLINTVQICLFQCFFPIHFENKYQVTKKKTIWGTYYWSPRQPVFMTILIVNIQVLRRLFTIIFLSDCEEKMQSF